jgi:hypothetical protein
VGGQHGEAHFWDMLKDTGVSKDEIYLHVRAGALFWPGGTHPRYAQPPCQYFTAAAAMHGAKKMVVVTDGGRNPCLRILESEGARILRCPANETLGRILHAYSFALARSTFSRSAFFLSQHLDDGRFYTFDIPQRLPAAHWDCEPTPSYRTEVMSEWKAKPSQIRSMRTSQCLRWNYIDKEYSVAPWTCPNVDLNLKEIGKQRKSSPKRR